MSEKEEKERWLDERIKSKIGKGRPLLESIQKKKTSLSVEQMKESFGTFVFDTTPEDLIKEIETSRYPLREVETLD